MTHTNTPVPKTSRLTIVVILLFTVVLAMMAGGASAQSSNPSLSTLPYSFTSYTGGSMPSSLKIGKSSSTTLSITDFTSDASHGNSSSEWDDEGSNGVSYQGNGTSPSGCFKLRMNTTGLSNISVTWTARRISNGSFSSSFMEMQYRSGSSGSWNNVSNDQYDSDNSSSTFNLLLPSAANNQSDLQIRWVIYDQNHFGGSRDRIAVDDINICAATPTNANNNGPICSGNTLNLTSTASGLTYAWTGPNGFTSSAQNPSISNAPATANGTYTLVVTNASGCAYTTTTNATVNTTPVATASSNSPACVGQTLNLTSGPNGYSYQWSGPGGYSSTSQNPSRNNATVAMSGTYTVTVTNSGCSSTISTVVTVNTIPTVSANSNTPVCAGNTINLTSTPSGGNYQWSGPASFSSTSQNPNRNNAQLNHAGTYTVTVTVGGCSASATTSVTVNNSPSVAPSSNLNTVCEGSNINLNANSSINFANTTSIAITDNSTSGVNTTLTLPAMSIANAAGMEVTLNFNPEHTYTGDVIVRLTNPSGQTTTLFDRPGVPATTYGNSDDLNGTYTFSTSGSAVLPESTGSGSSGGNINQGTYLPSATNGSSHNWSGFTFPVSTSGTWTLNLSDRVNGDVGTLSSWSIKIFTTTGMTYTWTSTPSGFTSSSATPTDNPSVNTTYHVTASYNGCMSAQGNRSISVNPSPTPVLNSNAPVCQGLTINFSGNNSASGQSSGNSYQWSGPNGFTSTQQNPNITSADAIHVGNYTLTVTNQYLCTATTSLMVGVNNNPSLSIASQTNVTCNGFSDGSYQISASGGTPDYLFTDGSNFNLDGIFTNNAVGSYSILATDVNGCEATINVNITEPSVLSFSENHVDEFCTNQNNGSITLSPSGGTAPYQFSIDNGSSFQSNPVFNGLSPASYFALISDANNCPVNTLPVNISSTYINFTTPVAVTTDDTDNQICVPAAISMDQVGGDLGNAPGTIYKWKIGSCNGPLAGSGTSGSLSLSPTSNTTYYLNIEGACGVSNCVPVSIIVSSAAPTSSVLVPPIVGLPAYACNGTMASISVPPVTGATMYVWDGPVGCSFESSGNNFSTNSPSSNMVFGSTVSSGYYIGVQAANACGSTLRKVQWVRGIVSVPSNVISTNGTFTQCENTTATFTCPPVVGATGYDWVITGHASLVSNGNTATVTFNNNWHGGTISVAAKTPCYTSPYKSAVLTTSASPTPQLTGVFTACPGALQSYSVLPVSGAANYSWTLPVNTNGSSNSNLINVNFNNGFTQGDICVQVTSACGVVSPLKCKTITSGAPSRPASITGLTNGLCNSVVNYQTPPVAGGLFNWTIPNGATGNSTNNAIGVTMPGNLSVGQVCVSVTNSCGTSASRCISVKGAPNTPASVIMTPSVICANEAGVQFNADISNVLGTYNLNWSFPSSATYVAGQNTSNLILDWGANSGTVLLTASNNCGTATRTYSVNLSCRQANNSLETANIMDENILSVSPNPASSFTKVSYPLQTSGLTTIEVMDLQGRLIISRNFGTGVIIDENIDLSGLSKGSYFIRFNTPDFSTLRKFMVD